MMFDGWGMGWMWLVWPLVTVGVVLLVVLLVRGLGSSSGGGQGQAPPPTSGRPPNRAREILDERYARGELSDEEYEERRRRLSDDGGR
ncbi:SHOCT domain-containing protein [Isoptericola haloaureus]|uniref:SHOCT domain-containing protein n=1 Tax=Isoptericola haloaureus TaxID=1542902 RepID=A0ABU7Z2K9_9MICO